MPRRRATRPRSRKAPRARREPSGPREGVDWIARALARAGVMPGDEAEAAVKAGRVQVAGQVVHQPFALVRPGDAVKVDGHPVSLAFETRVLVFHKPRGVVTAATDPHGEGTVFERLRAVLPERLARFGWHAVGRLDRDTTGLLLFSNDERLVEHATSPKTHLPRRYVAEVQGGPTEEKLEPLRRGITLDDGPARPAKARLREDGRVEVILTEGRNRQVRRMLGAVGLPVRKLHREAQGTLELDVPEGEVRALSPEEIEAALGFVPRKA